MAENNVKPPSITKFTYNGHEITVDGAKKIIYIDGTVASGINTPTGAVVSDIDIEDPFVCKVKRDLNSAEEEKFIPYGAPLAVNDPVLIIGNIVIPANLLIHNYLEDDYGYWAEKLKETAEATTVDLTDIFNQINTHVAEKIEEINSAAGTQKDEIVSDAKTELVALVQGDIKEYAEGENGKGIITGAVAAGKNEINAYAAGDEGKGIITGAVAAGKEEISELLNVDVDDKVGALNAAVSEAQDITVNLKSEINTFADGKKTEIYNYVNGDNGVIISVESFAATQKESILAYVENPGGIYTKIDNYTANKKEEINTFANGKITEINNVVNVDVNEKVGALNAAVFEVQGITENLKNDITAYANGENGKGIITGAVDAGKAEISDILDTDVGAQVAALDAAVLRAEDTAANLENDIEAAGEEQVKLVESAGEAQIGNINQFVSGKDGKLAEITSVGTEQIDLIESAGTTQKSLVENSGLQQINLVAGKGDDVIDILNGIIAEDSSLSLKLTNYYTKVQVDELLSGFKNTVINITEEMGGNLLDSIELINDEMTEDV